MTKRKVGRPAKSDDQKRSNMLMIPLTLEEDAMLRQLAVEHDASSLAAYARSLLIPAARRVTAPAAQ